MDRWRRKNVSRRIELQGHTAHRDASPQTKGRREGRRRIGGGLKTRGRLEDVVNISIPN